MPKANFTLPNGTVVSIDGTEEEVQRLLSVYSGPIPPVPMQRHGSASTHASTSTSPGRQAAPSNGNTGIDLIEIVNLIRTTEDSEKFETTILDHDNRLNRVLLPLFVVHEHKANAFGLTSGEINKITTELGVPVRQPDASKCLSGPARPYVIGDKMRIKGHPVRYKLNRRGVQYMQQILAASKG
jgi:hypothetical protein